jgi:hypothetical protein
MLAIVETASAIYRPARNRPEAYALVNAVVYRLEQLTVIDRIVQYPLNELRRDQAISLALRHRCEVPMQSIPL